jgi:hypothetical protein
MSTAKVNELINLLKHNVEEAYDRDYQARPTSFKAGYWLGKTGVLNWTPEEEKLWAELSPEEQEEVGREISARADGHESWDAAIREDHKRKAGASNSVRYH